jgi:uncharacterized protein (DUF58 family)
VNAAGACALLDPALLAALGDLELVARTAVEGFLGGLHRSLRPGFSLEFADYRDYEPGDDPRGIDWNAYARSERLVIKRYRGETTTHLMIALDASASMGVRTGPLSKLDYGRMLAAALAFLANRQHDPVGLIVFDEKLREYRPPSSRRMQLRSLLHALERAQPGARTDIAAALDRFTARVNRRGLVAVISDFFCPAELVLRSVRPLAARGQDVVLFQVLDPGDRAPALRDSTRLVDVETGQEMQVSEAFARREYPQRVERHVEQLARSARELGADHVLLDSARPLDAALRAYLAFRAGRRGA